MKRRFLHAHAAPRLIDTTAGTSPGGAARDPRCVNNFTLNTECRPVQEPSCWVGTRIGGHRCFSHAWRETQNVATSLIRARGATPSGRSASLADVHSKNGRQRGWCEQHVVRERDEKHACRWPGHRSGLQHEGKSSQALM